MLLYLSTSFCLNVSENETTVIINYDVHVQSPRPQPAVLVTSASDPCQVGSTLMVVSSELCRLASSVKSSTSTAHESHGAVIQSKMLSTHTSITLYSNPHQPKNFQFRQIKKKYRTQSFFSGFVV